MGKTVVVLGGTGMLGAMTTAVFARESDFNVVASVRDRKLGVFTHQPVQVRRFDAWAATVDDCRAAISGASWAVNCIGITKPLIAEDDPFKVERAIRVNALFPHTLAKAAEAEGVRVVQIATDCVFSGAHGNYREDSQHDALDVYGKTKSLGEVSSPNVRHLRVSVIGPEPKEHKFLLDWFLSQPRAAAVNGFTNHDWNGVTTLHYARIVLGIIRNDTELPKVHHLVPSGHVTKAAMLRAFAQAFDRRDIAIKDVTAGTVIDRTLATHNDVLNTSLWARAGYAPAPTVEQMIEEMANFNIGFSAQFAVA
jgi:dTDP-4-dehydrorhamnose reductase